MARKTYRVNADRFDVLVDLLVGMPTEFNTDKTPLRGREMWEGNGILPAGIATELNTAVRENRIEFVIYSYATPIAWLEWTGHDKPNSVYGSDTHNRRTGYSPRRWVIPNHKYSVTTSKHQGKVRTAISQISEACI